MEEPALSQPWFSSLSESAFCSNGKVPNRKIHRNSHEDRLSAALKYRRDPLPGPDAHGGEAEFRLPRFHGVNERGGNSGAARAQRMTERQGAAADIDLVRIGFQKLDHRQRLRGEDFISFNHVDVVELEPVSLQRLVR